MKVTLRTIYAVLVLVLVLVCSAASCVSQTAEDKQGAYAEHAQKAQSYLREKRPDLAIPELEAAVAAKPDSVDARGNLGVLLFFQGKYAQAVPQLRAAVGMKADLWKIQALLGIAERRTGDEAQGRADLEAAFPHIGDATGDEKLKVNVGLDLVESYSATEDLEKAAEMVAQLLRIKPDDPGLLYTSYRIHAQMMAQALLTLSLVAPESAQLHQAMAHELQRTHDLAGTIKNLREALAIDPKLPGLHFELAEALHASDDQRLRAEAETQYKLAVETNPSDPEAAAKMGDIEVEKGDLAAAEMYYRRALKLRPNDADATIGLANVASEKGDAAEAATLLEQVIAADPTNYLAHYRLSAVYRKLHRPDAVERELQAYKRYKDMHETLTNVYKKMEAPDKAPDKAVDKAAAK